VLRCHSDLSTSAAVGWKRRVAGGADELIVVACNILPSLKPTLSSVYSLIKDDPGQCDLVVNRTNTSLTGLYFCTEGTNTAAAQLTIIGQLLSMLLGGFTDVDNERNTDTILSVVAETLWTNKNIVFNVTRVVTVACVIQCTQM